MSGAPEGCSDVIAFTHSKDQDPDGSRLRGVIESHLECERARTIRELLDHMVVGASVMVWPAAVWPRLLPPKLRAFVLFFWAACFLELVVAAVYEWSWRRRRARFLRGKEPRVWVHHR